MESEGGREDVANEKSSKLPIPDLCCEMPRRTSPTSANSRTSPSISPKGVVLISDDDVHSPISLERNSSSKITAMAERRVARGLEMQQQLSQAQVDLKKLKNQLASIEDEKSHLLKELEETKKVADEATLRLGEALEAQKRAEGGWETEKIRSKEIEQASIESAQKRDQAWQLELEAVQREHALDVEALSSVEQELIRVNQELSSTIKARDEALKKAEDARRVAEANRKPVNGVSAELELLKKPTGAASSNPNGALETKETDMLTTQVNPMVEKGKDMEAQLPEKEALIKNLRPEISDAKDAEMPAANLLSESRKRIELLELELEQSKVSEEKTFELLVSQTEQLEKSKVSLEEAKFEIASLRENIRNLEAAVGQGIRDFILHVDHGKHSGECDPSSLLLLVSTRLELQDANMEMEDSKIMLKRIQKKFQALLDEVKREVDRAKQATERWRLEVEESQEAWNGKEAGFVQCMKISEEEMDDAKEENFMLIESLKKADEIANKARDESARLRDLLRQAVNEATLARESAEIARIENSQLKDNLSFMGSTLQTVTQENEQLKINEAAAREQVKELKNVLSVTSNKEPLASKKPKEQQKLNVKLEKPSIMNGYKNDNKEADLLKGSILEGQGTLSTSNSTTANRKAFSSASIDDKDMLSLDNFHESHFATNQKKKKAVLHRFGDLLKRRMHSVTK
ncbi:WEB family protein, chloroplastic-like protein [Cinnamomum micranthum f. kanehirae]|uniref:WEB family protein, chloroplastic-like protein n=1 Tax=Cinnamomum micranthum f. kanehirae TaxID=337451 RepID=A0A3S3MQ39_9MAGN|nr:WEB family protein, chloroplastic-like protein [Cinnamomum micranthum f. kanehirae]